MRKIAYVMGLIAVVTPLLTRAEKNESLSLRKNRIHSENFFEKDSLTPSDSSGVKDTLSMKDTLNTDSKDSLKVKKKKEKKKTPYELLFDKKKKETAKGGFITLHKVGEKLYFELPIKQLKKEVLFGSTISSVSDPSFLTVGKSYSDPITLYFDIQDSMVVVKRPNQRIYTPEKKKNIELALQSNFKDPTLLAFKIEAYNNDSTAVVFNMASVVGKNNSLFPIIPDQVGNYKLSVSPQNQLASVRKIKSFENNVSIRTELNYTLSASIMGLIPVVKDLPVTVEVTHSFILLPQEKMTPRLADARIGISSTQKIMLTDKQDGVSPIYFTNRWNLIPKNKQKYLSGGLSEPEKPIVFYLDNALPTSWKTAVTKGVLKWNSAFEKIGFKNAIEVRDFPQASPTFDPDNLSYSTIRYIPAPSEDFSSSFWADPNTGEILNGTLWLFANTENLLQQQRFVETAAVDATARNQKMTTEAFEESLALKVTHHIGKILGLEVNLAASSAFPTESLRNKDFTQKYGISASVMDINPFNYVAQPSDKGVALSQSKLGAYDFYAVAYNYQFWEGNNVQEDYRKLSKMVDAKASDAMYRYVPQQRMGIIDPSVLGGDLGDDAVLSATYGMKNLQYVAQNFTQWVKNDEDTQIKQRLYLLIAQKHYALFKSVLARVGGVRMNNSKESSRIPRYSVLPSQQQKKALLWSINTIKNFRKLANTSFERKGYMDVSYYDQLLEYLTADLFGTYKNIIIAEQLSKQTLSQKEFFDILRTEIFASADGRTLNNNELFLQKFFVGKAAGVLGSRGGGSKSAAPSLSKGLANASSSKLSNDTVVEGFGIPNQPLFPQVLTQGKDQSEILFYESLTQIKPRIEEALKKASNTEMKAHYNYLLLRINKIIEDASK